MSKRAPNEQLRDYFAAQIAATLVRDRNDHGAIAKDAYLMADALLAERASRSPAERPMQQLPLYANVSPDLEHWLIARESTQGLLDRPHPLEEEADEMPASWRDRDLDPGWETRVRWEPSVERTPGLASTRPAAATKREKTG